MPKNLKRIPLEDARNALVTIWGVGSAAAFLILLFQSILGKYSNPAEPDLGTVQEVWSWFVPIVFPTIALMIGVVAASAMQDDSDKRTVKEFFYRFARALSIFYLIVLLLTILIEPMSPSHGIKLFLLANYWLAPLQGLVVAVIGALFTSQEKSGPETPVGGATSGPSGS